jgi:outer membrane protein assembly factor BamA
VIRFDGAPEYPQQELLAAAGLRPDSRPTPIELKARAKQLFETGLFGEVKFTQGGKALVFTLSPSKQLFPMHLENVPLTPGKELDARLHDRYPLYRAVALPASGSMIDGICRALEEMLASKGIKATVKAAVTSGLGPQKITAMNFAVVSPAVHIGHIQLVGVSPAMQAKAGQVAGSQSGGDFDTERTATGLQHLFEDFYQDQGYAAVQVDVAEVDPPGISEQSIDIPYLVTIKEGGIYKLGTIGFAGSADVPRAEVERILARYPKGSGRPLDLYLLAVRDGYHAHGYLDCAVVSHAAFNEATRIVSYSVEVTPGSVYRLAAVQFDGAPEAMAARLKLAWKMAPGEIFDESYVSGFSAQAVKKDKALAKWMQTVVSNYDVKADPDSHEVTCIFHFAKLAETPR